MRCPPAPRGRLLVPLLLSAAALAQDRRAATIGSVRDAAGRPVAGAVVTLAGALPPPHDPIRAPDVVTAETDADGAFRVALLPGLDYSAWAIGPARDGRRLASQIVERVRAGSVVALPARRIAAPARLRVADFDRYPELPIRAVQLWLPTAPAAPVTLPLDADGTAALPPLPDAQVDVVALDDRGEPRFARGLRPEAEMTIHTYQPHAVPLLALDAEGAPVAGAVVHRQVHSVFGHDRTLWQRVGETDADGKLVAHAIGVDPYERGGGLGVLFAASAEGTTESFSGWCAGLFWRDGEKTEPPQRPPNIRRSPPPVEFVLYDVPARGGRLLEDGAPLAGREVFVDVDCPLRPSRWGRVGLRRRHLVRTAADGTFALPPLPRVIDTLQLAIAPPAEAPTAAPLLVPRDQLPGSPIEIDLAALPRLRLQVLRPGRSPATEAVAMLLPASTERPASQPRRLPCDRAGRVAVSVEPGRFLLFVHDAEHFDARLLAVAAGAGTVAAEVVLAPLAVVRGVVADADGRPLQGAQIHVTSMQSDRRLPRDEHEVLLRHYGLFLNKQLTGATRTDADGRFALRFLDLPGTSFGATTSFGGAFDLVAGDEVEVVRGQ